MGNNKDKEGYRLSRDCGIFRTAELVQIKPVSDARLGELNKALEIKHGSIRDLITSDINEILRRQEVSTWLLNSKIAKLSSIVGKTYSNNKTLPFDDRGFIKYQKNLTQGGTDFWMRAKGFMEIINTLKNVGETKLPTRIQELVDEIEANGEAFAEKENRLASKIIADMRSMVSIEGILTFPIDIYRWSKGNDVINSEKIVDDFCFGVKQYDPNLDNPLQQIEMPLWTYGPGKRIENLVNRFFWKMQHSSSRINHTPESIRIDIMDYVNRFFHDNKIVKTSHDELDNLSIQVAYQLDVSGLHVRIIDCKTGINVERILENKVTSIRCIDFHGDQGYHKVTKFVDIVARTETGIVRESIRAEVESWLIGVSHNWQKIKSDSAAEEFCLVYFKMVYSSFEDEIKEIQEWQAKIEKSFDDMVFLNGIIQKMKGKDLPISVPEIFSGGLIKAECAYPIRLSSVQSAILPFDRFCLADGGIANLTGRNGSGKTTLAMTMLDILLMAISGLPVPAIKVEIPLVNTILLSFLDRELMRSTFQAKLEKDTAIVKAVENMSFGEKQRLIVFLDEMGSATTQGNVLPLVKRYARWIEEQGVRMIMSTQILELSQFIGDDLGGTNFIIEKDDGAVVYNIKEGIGEGEPMEMARESGLLGIIGGT